MGCFLIRYLKSRGYRVISYFWRSFTSNQEYRLIDKAYQFPNDNWYSSENIDKLIRIINQESVLLLLDVSFVEHIHEICYQAKTQCGIKSILLYQGDSFAYTKSLIDKNDERKFSHQLFGHRLLNLLKSPFSYLNRYRSTKDFHRKNLFYSDLYVVLSQSYVKDIANLLHLRNTSGICAISNAVEPFCEKEKKKQVVFVGRMDWQKRIDRLLRIWKRVSSCLPDWNLILVGDGPYLDRFKEYARNISLKQYSFVGACPAQSFIEESSVLCLTSTHEGFGLTLVEAQSCGCVPIAFDSYAAVRDIIDDGISGLLIPPFKEKQYANAIVYLCKNDTLRKELADNCIENSKKFAPEIIEQKWDAILDRI